MAAKFKLACHTITLGKDVIAQDPKHVMHQIKQAGYEAIEGFNATNDEELNNLMQLARMEGLQLVFSASPTDEQRIRNALSLGQDSAEICRGSKAQFGARIDEAAYRRYGEQLREAVSLYEKHGIKPYHHIHIGCMIETEQDAKKVLEYTPGLYLLLDTGHLLLAGSDPMHVIESCGSRIAHVHLKDIWIDNPDFERVFPMKPKRYVAEWEFIELGQGNCGCDFAAVLHRLERIGYDGYVTVEQDTSRLEAIESAVRNRQFLRHLGYD